jgi:ribonuclease HI
MKCKVYKKNEQVDESEYDYIIYTDGSANNITNRMGGWAFVVLRDGKILMEDSGSEKETTNNRMELMAIINAVSSVAGDGNKSICVYTDSEYCIGVLSQKWSANVNRDLISPYINMVYDLNLRIDFKWVKGHFGNKWNDYVDKKANQEYENLSGEKQIDWKDKNQVKELLKQRAPKYGYGKGAVTLQYLHDSLVDYLRTFYSESNIQTIFDSVDYDEILNTFLDWVSEEKNSIINLK